MKKVRRWLALILAIVLVAVNGFYQLGTSLQASEDQTTVETQSVESEDQAAVDGQEPEDSGEVQVEEIPDAQEQNTADSSQADENTAAVEDNDGSKEQTEDASTQEAEEQKEDASTQEAKEKKAAAGTQELTANEDGTVSGSGYDSITLEINTDGIKNQNNTAFNITFDTGNADDNRKISASNLNPSNGVAKNLRKNNGGTFTVNGFSKNAFTITVSKVESSKNSVKAEASVDQAAGKVTLKISDYYESSYEGAVFTNPTATSLGSVNDFAIFANNYKNHVDMEGNIAVKNMLLANTNGGNSDAVQGRDFSLNYVENFVMDSMKSEFFREADPLIVGDAYEINTQDSNYTLKLTSGAVINLGPSDKVKDVVNISNSSYQIDFASAMEGLKAYADNLYGKSDTKDLKFKDSQGRETTASGNVQVIECKADVNNIINIKASDLTNWADNVQIKGLGTTGSVVFNIEYDEAKQFTKPHFSIDGSGTNEYDAKGGRILLNFGTQAGEITFGELYSGTILAPNATVDIYTTHNGSVFADTVENINGEIHKNPWKPGKDDTDDNNNDDKETSVDIALKGTKTLDGQSAEAGKFSFILQQTEADGKVMAGGYSQEVKNGANGAITFDKITYKAPGTYYYQITEKSDGQEDIIYDTTFYTAVVTVTKDGENLTADVKYYKNLNGKDITAQTASENAEFNNRTWTRSGSVTFAGNKTLNGKAAADAFRYSVAEKSASGETMKNGYISGIIKNDTTGAIQFQPISYTEAGTHYYEVTEIDDSQTTTGITYDSTVYTAVVTVSKDNSADSTGLKTEVKYYKDFNYATKTGTEVSKITFANNMSASLKLSGTKTLDGDSVTTAGDYKFDIVEVADANGKTLDGAESQTVSNDKNGKFEFPEYTYTDAGVHYYKITENQNDKKDGIKYDTSSYIVTVTVAKTTDNNGKISLKAEVTDITKTDANNVTAKADAITFNNETISYTDAEIQLTATKNLAGTPSAKAFNFEMAECDENGNVADGAEIVTAGNDENGYVSFDKITYKFVGTHYYKISEVIPETPDENIIYDHTAYIVKVDVTKDDATAALTATVSEYKKIVTGEDGNATIDDADSVVFNNGMKASVTFDGKKYVDGELASEAGKYSFTLTRTDESYANALTGEDAYSETVQNDASGNITFAEINYDTPGDYYYTVSENVPADRIPNMYYDEAVYRAKVTVSQDGQVTVEKSVVPYVGYEEDNANDSEPVEDDEFLVFNNYNLMLMSMKYGLATITGTKVLTGGDLEAGEFRFGLYDANGTLIDTTTNDASGKIAFRTIPYYNAGDYTYTVKEINEQGGENASNITYDTSTYKVTVNVDNNMNTSITYEKDGVNVDNLSFENKMSVTAAVIDPAVTKVLNNAKLQPGEFTFQLFDENDNLVDTKKNTEEGAVLFDSIVFDKEGEYNYTIRELIPEEEGQITYDGREIGVTVEVTKNEETGNLEAAVIYTEDGKETETPTFVNTYHPINIRVQKTSRDGSKDPLQGATYALYKVIGEEGRDLLIGTQVSDAEGYMVFENVEPGIYYFKEVAAPAGHTVDEYATKRFTVLPNGEISSIENVSTQTALLGQVTAVNNVNTGVAGSSEEDILATATAGDSDAEVSAQKTAEAPGVSDEVTKLNVSKLDYTSHEFVSGAKMQIIEKETGNIVAEWTTGDSAESFERQLNVETPYILREVSAPEGYGLAVDTEFTIDAYGILSITSGSDAEKTSDTSLSIYDKKLGVTKTVTKTTEKHNKKYVDKADKTDKTNTSNNKANTIKTGDTARIGLFALLAVVAVIVIVVILRRRKDS